MIGFAPAVMAGVLSLGTVALAQEPERAERAEEQALQELIESQRSELSRLHDELAELRDEQNELRRNLRKPYGLPYGERVAYGEAVVVRADEKTDEVIALGNDVRIAGRVLGNATALGGDVVVIDGGIVEGDAISFGGSVRVQPGGVVRGDRITLSGLDKTASRAQGSTSAVHGFLSGLYSRLIMLLCFAGAGVMVVGLVPQRVGRIATRLETHPVRSGIVGVVASGFLALSSALFAITFIGLPVSFVLMALLGLAWLMGFVGLCQAVGDRLPFQSKHHGRWLAFLVGTLLLTFLGSLPWVGFLVVAAASVIGMGASLSTRFGSV